MFANYFKIAWRNITGSPLFSLINIIGLAIGLACCIIITVFVRHEISYDKHWQDADRVYRVTRDFFGNQLRLASVAAPIGALLDEDFPEIETMTRILNPGQLTLSYDGENVREDKIAVADPNVFEIFNVEFIEGDAETALADPSGLVMTRRAAERYFGNEDPLGKSLTLLGQLPLTVTALIEDLPDNTHVQFELLASLETVTLLLGEDEMENWGSNNYYTYLKLPAGYDYRALEARFRDFMVKHRGEDEPANSMINLQKMTDIHLHSDRDSEWRANGSIAVVYTFSAVALFVLLIACINFMNLTTARSTQRAREVGIRKVVGAKRSQLIAQFLGEGILLTSIAMLLAISIVEVVLPYFAAFLEKPLEFHVASPAVLAMLAAGVIGVGLLAGSYPALYLSRFRPAEVLKGADTSTGSGTLRKVLVVFQFATSIALLVATGVVFAQMNYAKNMEPGYDKSRNLIAGLPFLVDLWETYEPLKAELEAHPDIESVVYSSRVPSMQSLDGSGYVAEGEQVAMDSLQGLADLKVDWQWFEHYGIEFLAGRPFLPTEMRPPEPTDEQPVVRAAAILDESGARRFGWTPKEAIGKIIRQPNNRDLTLFYDREVVGVVPDIYFSSLRDERKATVYAEPHPDYSRNLSVKIAAGDPADAIAHFEQTWKKLVPDQPVNWQFLDDRFDALYRSEQRQAKMFGFFSAFAIFVATLGLFGLASFTTERRTKEIGIRKVMGATVKDIVWLLTSDFTKLVLLANLIAWPVAFYFMSQWLNRFAYQAPFADWAWLFLASALAALAVAWLTIALQASKAASSRPVLALRYE
jgi:putative ABC transport system permease protein